MSSSVAVDRSNSDQSSKYLLSNEEMKNEIPKMFAEFPLLTRADLLKSEAEEPKWKRTRLGLFALFVVVWLLLLLIAVLVIILSPKCPPTPVLKFWEDSVGYWVDPFAFKDSNSDKIGDLKGIVNSLSYLKDTIGAGFVILGSFVTGSYTNSVNTIGLSDSYKDIDPALGTMEDFRLLIREVHKAGMKVVITLDFNAVSEDHSWAKRPSFLQLPVEPIMISRSGEPASVLVGWTAYYSVADKKRMDLNFRVPMVVDEIKDVIRFWFSQEVDGLLLTNAAFFIEAESEVVSNYTMSSNKWFATYPSSQLFTKESAFLVKVLRDEVDQISRKIGKDKLLVVDSGNCGYGLRKTDDASLFSGKDGAHLLVSRQFVKERGWKVDPIDSSWKIPSLASYLTYNEIDRKSLLLTTATPNDQLYDDYMSLALTLLLPGTPVIYYGTELGLHPQPSLMSPSDMYPMGKVPYPNFSLKDSAISAHLPMPWDSSGKGFSSAIGNHTFRNYMKNYTIGDTVESVMAYGRGDSVFSLVTRLIKLRRALLTLQFGDVIPLTKSLKVSAKNVDLFMRSAPGYRAVIIAFIQQTNHASVYDFTPVCDHVMPRLTYPTNSKFKLGTEVDASRIYLRTSDKPAIFVFECTIPSSF